MVLPRRESITAEEDEEQLIMRRLRYQNISNSREDLNPNNTGKGKYCPYLYYFCVLFLTTFRNFT